jgi:DNA-binding CsgD family transcriptional regulator
MSDDLLTAELVERAGLTEKELEALRLWHPGQYGYDRIAESLDISKRTVRQRIRSGMQKLERATREVG